MKGLRQTLAQNESERDSAVREGEPAWKGEAPFGIPGRDWRWDRGNSDAGDRGRPRWPPLRPSPPTGTPPRKDLRSERRSADEESERFRVASPLDDRSERRGVPPCCGIV